MAEEGGAWEDLGARIGRDAHNCFSNSMG
jgi:hypothetical protein